MVSFCRGTAAHVYFSNVLSAHRGNCSPVSHDCKCWGLEMSFFWRLESADYVLTFFCYRYWFPLCSFKCHSRKYFLNVDLRQVFFLTILTNDMIVKCRHLCLKHKQQSIGATALSCIWMADWTVKGFLCTLEQFFQLFVYSGPVFITFWAALLSFLIPFSSESFSLLPPSAFIHWPVSQRLLHSGGFKLYQNTVCWMHMHSKPQN